MLLNAAKFQGYSFYHFWIIKGKATGEGAREGIKLTPIPPRLGIINNAKLTLSSISNDLPFWSVKIMIILWNSLCYKFSKTLNYLDQYLTNKHKTYLE